jgi:apolipoprotein N-acyltransferase
MFSGSWGSIFGFILVSCSILFVSSLTNKFVLRKGRGLKALLG